MSKPPQRPVSESLQTSANVVHGEVLHAYGDGARSRHRHPIRQQRGPGAASPARFQLLPCVVGERRLTTSYRPVHKSAPHLCFRGRFRCFGQHRAVGGLCRVVVPGTKASQKVRKATGKPTGPESSHPAA